MNINLKLPRLLAFGLALAALPSSLSAAETARAESRQPNIVVILGDDLGYADIGANGGKEIPTPHIDSLARNGVRFTSGYVSGPYCSPTRAALLTGRYQQRFGHEFNPGGPQATNRTEVGLALTEVTVADRLKAAGYRTGLVGKWHLGYADKFHPLERGFDEFFGFLGGAHSYTNLDVTGPDPIQRGRQAVEEKEHLTDAFTREAVAFIERHRQQRFFLYLAYNAVHNPLEPAPKHLERVKHIADEKRRRFAALLAGLDDGVGAVLAKLHDAGLERDTLVVFFTDNGGPTAGNTSRNDPLRGFKATTWEGGIRVPFIVQWRGHLPEGRTQDRPIIQLDILPTVLAAAGVTVRPEWKLDGVNLLPFLTSANAGTPHEALYWRFGQQLAIRQGDWKLVKGNAPGRNLGAAAGPDAVATTEGAELYHLATDIGETNNLATKEPAKFRELADAWNAWNVGLVPASWTPPAQQAGRQQARASRDVQRAPSPQAQ